MSLIQYRFPYHIHRDHVVLFPIDGRTGQLLTGALEGGASNVNVGGKANTIRAKVGDTMRLISDDTKLSANPYSEVTVLNGDDRVITSMTDQTISVDPDFVDEPNSESLRFFEFQILRESPYHKVTFARALQTMFTPVVFFNGVLITPTVTNPTGQVTVVEDDFGTLTFTPLGSGRWSIAMEIILDGTIDLTMADGGDTIELSLSNMNVWQDIPMFTVSNDGARLGPWTVARLRVAERTLGTGYVTGNAPDIALRRLLIETDRGRVPTGTTAEFLVVIKNRDDLEVVNLDGVVVTWEARDSAKRALKATGIGEVVSAGLVRVEIPADALGEGVYTLELEINFGGNPEFVLRTSTVVFFVGG